MKYQLTQEQWIELHTLIGETKGSLECAAIQLTEEQKHMVSPFRCLVERWELFIENIKAEEK